MRTSKRALPGRLKVELAGVATDPAELITDDAESRHAKPATPLPRPSQQMLSPLPLSNNLVLASNDVLSSEVDVECDRSPAGKSGVSHLLIYSDHQRGNHKQHVLQAASHFFGKCPSFFAGSCRRVSRKLLIDLYAA